MNYQEVLKKARMNIGPYCKACEICNGKACTNMIPGPGAKGSGKVAINNYQAWQDIALNLDTIYQNKDIDMSITMFGHKFKYPFFAGPVGNVKLHYSDYLDDYSYNQILVKACAENNICAFTGDGLDREVFQSACLAIKKNNGVGIPTIKPWNKEVIAKKLIEVAESDCFAVAMDIDAAGLPFLKNMEPKAGCKSVEELKEIIAMTNKPFIIKGVMTVKGALKAVEAGACGIVVSNHGGRVLDSCLSTASVLKEISNAVKGKLFILVDGGIRSGIDVFKALALGADGVVICRPFVCAAYGEKEDGVKAYIQKIAQELEETMYMCGASKIEEINYDMITCLKERGN